MSLDLGVIADLEPRLLRTAPGRESLAEYRASGGYRAVPDGAAVLDLVEASGLRGRGGASFPTGRKIRAVRDGDGVPVVVANGEEGEPASVKDRWLLRHRPHLILDGLRYAVAATGAGSAYVYVSDDEAERSVVDAVAELGPSPDGLPEDLRVVRVEPSYVAGEETAAVSFLNGGPALPQDKPPRPFESGVAGRPTMVSNVETLANLPVLHGLGAPAYRAVGSDRAPGTFLLTLTGAVHRPGLYEVPVGVPLGVALQSLGGTPDRPSGFLMGGYFGGLLGARGLDLPLDYDALSAEGNGLGCGAITVLGRDDCAVHVAADVMAYFARENAGQCGSCFNGTAAMAGSLAALRAQTASASDVERLRGWSTGLKGRGACGTLDGAAGLAASLLREFPAAVVAHLDGTCTADHPPLAIEPFAVRPPGSSELLESAL